MRGGWGGGGGGGGAFWNFRMHGGGVKFQCHPWQGYGYFLELPILGNPGHSRSNQNVRSIFAMK